MHPTNEKKQSTQRHFRAEKAARSGASDDSTWAVRPLPARLAAVFGGGLWLCAGLASAQSAGTQTPERIELAQAAATKADDGTSLPSVTVTAQKRLQAAQDVAAAVNVLSSKKLEEENIGRSANEIINYIPNATAYGAPHSRPRWWIRGVGTGIPQQDLPNPVGFYLDEVYFPNASATNFPIFDLSRVEVLSGPQGTLWGKNTTGGAIHIVSREPRFTRDGYVKLGYGSHNTKVYEGAVGGTLVEDVLAFRVSAHQEDQGKRYDNVFTGQKEGDLQDGAYRFQLLGTFTNDFEALLNLHYRKLRTTGGSTTGSPAEGQPYYYPLVRFNFPTGEDQISSLDGNRWSRADTSQNGANLKLRWRFGEYELVSISAYEDYGTGTSTGPGSPYVSGANWSYSDYFERWLSQEVRLASPRGDRFNWIVGGHYFHDRIDTDGRSVQLGGYPTIAGRTSTDSSLTDDGYDHKTISRAAFGSATYNFTKQLEATLGLRFTQEYKSYGYYRNAWAGANVAQQDRWWENTTGTGSTASSFPQQGLSKSWNATTYDFTPAYQLSDTQRVFFRYAHGIKSGGFNTRVNLPRQIYAVEPETLDSYELGYKSEWLGGRLNFNANVFHYTYENQQINISGPYGVVDPVSGVGANLSILQNAKKGHANGAEFTVEAQLTDRFHVNANLGLLSTKFDDLTITDPSTGQSFRRIDGAEFVRSPHVNALLQLDYRFSFASGDDLVLGADWKYTSKQYYYVVPQDTVPQLQQGAYSLVAARARYNFNKGKSSLSLHVTNLLNKKYNAHGSVVSQSANTTGWGYSPGAPRNISLALLHRF